jgi:hypothetical protein
VSSFVVGKNPVRRAAFWAGIRTRELWGGEGRRKMRRRRRSMRRKEEDEKEEKDEEYEEKEEEYEEKEGGGV